MGGQVVCASDLGDSSVGRHDDDGSLVAFKSSVQEGEALDVEHMNLIDEEDTGHDFSAALFSPLGDFLVNLLSNLGLDLTDVTCEQSHEALGARVDHIDLVEGHSVNNLLPLLELTLGALNEAGLGADIVEVGASGERATKLGDLAASLVNSDDIAGNNLLLGDSLDHLSTQVVGGFHLSGLQGDLARLGSTGNGLVNLDLDDLAFDNLSFFSDPHACTHQSFKLDHSNHHDFQLRNF